MKSEFVVAPESKRLLLLFSVSERIKGVGIVLSGRIPPVRRGANGQADLRTRLVTGGSQVALLDPQRSRAYGKSCLLNIETATFLCLKRKVTLFVLVESSCSTAAFLLICVIRNVSRSLNEVFLHLEQNQEV